MINMQANSLEEELIEAVRQRPSLWDISKEKYHDAPYRNILWLEISEQLSEYFATPDTAQHRWNNLRDCYRWGKRNNRLKRSRDSRARTDALENKYKFAKQMGFLEKNQTRQT